MGCIIFFALCGRISNSIQLILLICRFGIWRSDAAGFWRPWSPPGHEQKCLPVVTERPPRGFWDALWPTKIVPQKKFECNWKALLIVSWGPLIKPQRYEYLQDVLQILWPYCIDQWSPNLWPVAASSSGCHVKIYAAEKFWDAWQFTHFEKYAVTTAFTASVSITLF